MTHPSLELSKKTVPDLILRKVYQEPKRKTEPMLIAEMLKRLREQNETTNQDLATIKEQLTAISQILSEKLDLSNEQREVLALLKKRLETK